MLRQIDPLDVPQARRASADVLRALAGIDERLTLLHSRGRRWLLCRYVPEKIDQRIAARMLGTATEAVRAGRRIGPDGNARVRQALLARLGWKVVGVYTTREPDGALVEDVRQSFYATQNTREQDLLASFTDEDEDRRARSRAMMGDEARAREAHGFLTRSSFGRAVPSVQSSIPRPLPTGTTRVSTIPA